MNCKECKKCGAKWIDGQLYWTGTGKKGKEEDLAGLVCNKLGDDQCINPKRGVTGGDTFEKRTKAFEKIEQDMTPHSDEL
ncbi:hypothetical protein [Synechococcus phage S-N03]|uniref:Uncharacterized protein n=1 Tax=Synechococcus phage S-N03 TaxID=2718943 RepID=A0A6G8R607_9CAUD|nr:hypothetical protein PQC09_gp241 [Synechococcus phage S-N03]QIN96826.1 hypothetical protein [Synechococcus phage S-N03]